MDLGIYLRCFIQAPSEIPRYLSLIFAKKKRLTKGYLFCIFWTGIPCPKNRSSIYASLFNSVKKFLNFPKEVSRKIVKEKMFFGKKCTYQTIDAGYDYVQIYLQIHRKLNGLLSLTINELEPMGVGIHLK